MTLPDKICVLCIQMNRNLTFLVIGGLVLLLVGYMVLSNRPEDQTPQETITSDETTSPASEEITVMLDEQNDSGESGTATLVEENGQVKVTLTLTGAPQGVTQPAHIHTGSCPDVGAVTYPLTSPVDGASETMLDVTLDQLRSEMPLAINVHKSTQEASVYVSCGNLPL